MKEIILTNGMATLVDDEDFESLSKKRWRAFKPKSSLFYYAVSGGKSKPMHRQILNAPAGVAVDHVNGNGLDNRRANLRLATPSQNQQNRCNLTRNTSGYRGITHIKRFDKWQSQIKHMGRNYYLGWFNHPEDAARAYDQKARELFGEFARVNFPLNESEQAA